MINYTTLEREFIIVRETRQIWGGGNQFDPCSHQNGLYFSSKFSLIICCQSLCQNVTVEIRKELEHSPSRQGSHGLEGRTWHGKKQALSQVHRTWNYWRKELMDCSRVWEPQHSSRKQESGYLEKGDFGLDFKGLSHREGNEICPWLMKTREGKIILQYNTQ